MTSQLFLGVARAFCGEEEQSEALDSSTFLFGTICPYYEVFAGDNLGTKGMWVEVQPGINLHRILGKMFLRCFSSFF